MNIAKIKEDWSLKESTDGDVETITLNHKDLSQEVRFTSYKCPDKSFVTHKCDKIKAKPIVAETNLIFMLQQKPIEIFKKNIFHANVIYPNPVNLQHNKIIHQKKKI